jgi:hypothetical protein
VITDTVLGFLVDIIGFALSLIPQPAWPTWLVGSGDGTVLGAFDWVGDRLSLFSAWVNMPLLMTVGGFLLSVKLTVLGMTLTFRVYALLRGSS